MHIDYRFFLNFIRNQGMSLKKKRGLFFLKQQSRDNLSVVPKNFIGLTLNSKYFLQHSLFLNSIFSIKSFHYNIFNSLKYNFFFSFRNSTKFPTNFSLLDCYLNITPFFFFFKINPTAYPSFFFFQQDLFLNNIQQSYNKNKLIRKIYISFFCNKLFVEKFTIKNILFYWKFLLFCFWMR